MVSAGSLAGGGRACSRFASDFSRPKHRRLTTVIQARRRYPIATPTPDLLSSARGQRLPRDDAPAAELTNADARQWYRSTSTSLLELSNSFDVASRLGHFGGALNISSAGFGALRGPGGAFIRLAFAGLSALQGRRAFKRLCGGRSPFGDHCGLRILHLVAPKMPRLALRGSSHIASFKAFATVSREPGAQRSTSTAGRLQRFQGVRRALKSAVKRSTTRGACSLVAAVTHRDINGSGNHCDLILAVWLKHASALVQAGLAG